MTQHTPPLSSRNSGHKGITMSLTQSLDGDMIYHIITWLSC